ncbi:phospholipid/cholesterol/gamma-HCH transport system permease protein [Nocardioides sp. J9]|uniref:MlaE family ABC transporter permease n=1 Tax=Nocardioides sp. J9 TaxID=935844 RepID=UPI0011A9DD3C|nr:ABC transporter permease [Nocardioides sp. J9]TWG94929.1 phospholipid/cholesterol/gamma-HCH transport system permease protein [Nocardioides sp. J9]
MASVMQSVAKPTSALGQVLAMSLDALVIMFTKGFSWRETVQQAWFVARVSLVPTLLVMLGFTLLVIFEINLLLRDIGALDLAGAIAGLASVQQIGPFVTVVVVAGAGGTAMCADLAARTIREEIAAMQVLGIDPIQRLVVPRIVAAVLVSMLLNVLICSGGLVGGYFFSVYLQGVTPGSYLDSIPLFTAIPELMVSMIKSFVFGLVAGIIACYRGLNVSGGSKGVGDAVNQAVVITVAVLVPISLVISLIQFAIL